MMGKRKLTAKRIRAWLSGGAICALCVVTAAAVFGCGKKTEQDDGSEPSGMPEITGSAEPTKGGTEGNPTAGANQTEGDFADLRC